MLEKDFEYYLTNRNDLLKSFKDTFIVIQNQSVLKALNTIDEAYKYLLDDKEVGSYLIQEVKDNEYSKTVMFTV